MTYGYCPHCGGEAVSRERRLNGSDTCVNGHVYPSAFTLAYVASEWWTRVRDTLAVVSDELLSYADGDRRLSDRQIRELAHRCKRTLNSIPLVDKK